MNNKICILYTMKGCVFCSKIKEKLNEQKLKFTELDIDDYKEEYELFKEITKNEFIPAFMIIETTKMESELFAPDRDFSNIDEAVNIIRDKII
jgi:glutaredoxin